jgi:hypothetical protein
VDSARISVYVRQSQTGGRAGGGGAGRAGARKFSTHFFTNQRRLAPTLKVILVVYRPNDFFTRKSLEEKVRPCVGMTACCGRGCAETPRRRPTTRHRLHGPRTPALITVLFTLAGPQGVFVTVYSGGTAVPTTSIDPRGPRRPESITESGECCGVCLAHFLTTPHIPSGSF